MVSLGIRCSEAAGPGGRVRSAVRTLLASGNVAVLLAVGLSSLAWSRTALSRDSSVRPECRVQIVSVKLSKATIHTTRRPREVVLRVTVDVRGRPPKGATTMVEVGTYSADPPGNSVVYAPSSREVPLSPGRTSVEFSVHSSQETTTGSVVIAASLELKRQAGVRIISMQPNYRQWRTRLTTRVP